MLDHFLVQPTPIQSQPDDFLYPPAIFTILYTQSFCLLIVNSGKHIVGMIQGCQHFPLDDYENDALGNKVGFCTCFTHHYHQKLEILVTTNQS